MNPSLAPSPSALRILYAEDNESDFFIFHYIIKKIFHEAEVIRFHDGLDLMDYLKAQGKFKNREKALKQHIIFLDINMPKLDGFELLEMIKNHSNQDIKNLPICMISTSTRPEDIQRSQVLGAVGYIIKSSYFEDMKKGLSDLIQTSLQDGSLSWTLI